MSRRSQDALDSWRRSDALLSEVLEQQGEDAGTMNGRSFIGFVPETDRAGDLAPDEEMNLRLDHWSMLLAYLFAFGPAPDRVSKRLFALTWALDRKLLRGLKIGAISEMLGEQGHNAGGDFAMLLALWRTRGMRYHYKRAANAEEIEARWKQGDAVLSAAYQRARVIEPKLRAPSFVSFLPEVGQLSWDETVEEKELRQSNWLIFLAFIFAHGAEVERVTKRVYAMTWFVARKQLLGMNIREVSDVLGEVRATGSNRIGTDFSDLLKRWGFKGTRVHGQKKETSRETYADVAQGNTSRQQGRKKGDLIAGG